MFLLLLAYIDSEANDRNGASSTICYDLPITFGTDRAADAQSLRSRLDQDQLKCLLVSLFFECMPQVI